MEKPMNMPEIIYPGDPRVCVLLGRQSPQPECDSIRSSCFVVHHYVNGKYLLFHTLTRRALMIEPELITYFIPGSIFSSDILENKTLQAFYEQYFLVSVDCREDELYQETKDIIRLKEELPEGIISYVILPTTACNARCFYCFEQGMRYHTMSVETEQLLLTYMTAHKPANNIPISIQWFGGEPLIGAGVINHICEGLREAGIPFTSTMITNGSLFTQALVKKAVSLWNLKEVQITLDGCEEEYLRRKRYLSSVADPFHTVLWNAHSLLKAGISVHIRLNLDVDNIGELYRCVDFLEREFTEPAERKLLTVYSHELFGKYCGGCDQSGDGRTDLTVYVNQLNDYIRRKKLDLGKRISQDAFSEHKPAENASQAIPPVGMLKSTYCMADRAQHTVVIDAEGRLYTCEGMPENLCYGDLQTGVNSQDHFNSISTPSEIPETCRHCAYLPECTDFLLCPNRETPPRCLEQARRKLDQGILGIYNQYQRKSEEPDV